MSGVIAPQSGLDETETRLAPDSAVYSEKEVLSLRRIDQLRQRLHAGEEVHKSVSVAENATNNHLEAELQANVTDLQRQISQLTWELGRERNEKMHLEHRINELTVALQRATTEQSEPRGEAIGCWRIYPPEAGSFRERIFQSEIKVTGRNCEVYNLPTRERLVFNFADVKRLISGVEAVLLRNTIIAARIAGFHETSQEIWRQKESGEIRAAVQFVKADHCAVVELADVLVLLEFDIFEDFNYFMQVCPEK